MMTLIDNIKKEVSSNFDLLVSMRRHLHMYPELSFEENETSLYVQNVLKENEIEFTKNWVKTGIVARIKGSKPGSMRAMRAELDALPIQELSEHTYISKNKGRMHACGHDVHTSCVLGAALILNKMKSEIEGEIVVVFQPGEELLPGGASLMLREGIFNELKPEYIIAQHVFPDLEVGKVGVCSGQYMASADEIYITIIGRGGHGALPHLCVDTILVASQVIVALQSIVSRNNNPFIPSVLTIGKINSVGGATNIIPDEVKIEGTFRTMDEAWRKKAHSLIEKVIKDICHSFGARAEVKIEVGYPSLYNDIELTKEKKKLMEEYLGEENVINIPQRMTSEDFSYYSQVMPSLFYRLGVRNEDRNIVHGVHTPYFDIDEKALEVGTGLMVYMMMK